MQQGIEEDYEDGEEEEFFFSNSPSGFTNLFQNNFLFPPFDISSIHGNGINTKCKAYRKKTVKEKRKNTKKKTSE